MLFWPLKTNVSLLNSVDSSHPTTDQSIFPCPQVGYLQFCVLLPTVPCLWQDPLSEAADPQVLLSEMKKTRIQMSRAHFKQRVIALTCRAAVGMPALHLQTSESCTYMRLDGQDRSGCAALWWEGKRETWRSRDRFSVPGSSQAASDSCSAPYTKHNCTESACIPHTSIFDKWPVFNRENIYIHSLFQQWSNSASSLHKHGVVHHAGRAKNGSCWPNVLQLVVSPSGKSCVKCDQRALDCREAAQHCCRHFPHILWQKAVRAGQEGPFCSAGGQGRAQRANKSTLTLWLNMSVSCRSCVYWHRCCRIISTLSTSSLSSSWTWRKTSPYFYWNLSLEAQRKEDTQKAARRCHTAPGSCFGAGLCGCTFLCSAKNKKQQATAVISA